MFHFLQVKIVFGFEELIGGLYETIQNVRALNFGDFKTPSQQAHDVKTTLLRRHFNVLTSLQRPFNVVLTSCAGWARSYLDFFHHFWIF